MSLAAVILAAGASSRMGVPKPLLEIAGETFLDRLIALFDAKCAPVIAVLGDRAGEIRAGCRRADQAAFVVNANWKTGMLSSLQCGLRALPAGIDAFAFTPVDSPRVSPAAFAALADRFERSRPPVAIPRFDGRRGHPVLCSAALIPEFLSLPSEAQVREVIHRHLPEAVFEDVDDPAVLDDIDDPQAYRTLLERAEAQ